LLQPLPLVWRQWHQVDVTYGALCSVPPEIVQVLWRENAISHRKFHPHLSELTSVIFSYLTQNAQTKHLKIDVDELDGVLRTFARPTGR
jgi:hypothetical protein